MSIVNGRQFAESVGLDPKWLRELIRTHRLMPSQIHGAPYEITPGDRARILSHPAVQQAITNHRLR